MHSICSVRLCIKVQVILILKVPSLALYHVITGLLSGMACVLEAVSILYYDRPDSDDPPSACIAIAFTIQYCVWMKLCFTFWVTFHLFSYAVCYRNLKRLELLYVLTSLIIPMIVSVIPLATGSYGLAGSWCWIRTCTGSSAEKYAGLVE